MFHLKKLAFAMMAVVLGCSAVSCNKNINVNQADQVQLAPQPVKNNMIAYVPADADAVVVSTGNMVADSTAMTKMLAMAVPFLSKYHMSFLEDWVNDPLIIAKRLGMYAYEPVNMAAYLKDDAIVIHFASDENESFDELLSDITSELRAYSKHHSFGIRVEIDQLDIATSELVSGEEETRLPEPARDDDYDADDEDSEDRVAEKQVWYLINFSPWSSFDKDQSRVTIAARRVNDHAVIVLVPEELEGERDEETWSVSYDKVVARLNNYADLPENSISSDAFGMVTQDVLTTGFAKMDRVYKQLLPGHVVSGLRSLLDKNGSSDGFRFSIKDKDKSTVEDDGCESLLEAVMAPIHTAVFNQRVVDDSHIVNEWRMHVDQPDRYQKLESMHVPSRPLDMNVVSGKNVAFDLKQALAEFDRIKAENPEAAKRCGAINNFVDLATKLQGEQADHDAILDALSGFSGFQFIIKNYSVQDSVSTLTYSNHNDEYETTEIITVGNSSENKEIALDLYGMNVSSRFEALKAPVYDIAKEIPFGVDGAVKAIFESENEVKPFSIGFLRQVLGDMKVIRDNSGLRIASNDEAWLKNPAPVSDASSNVFYESVEQIESHLGLNDVVTRAPGYVHQRLLTEAGDLVFTTLYYLPDDGWEKRVRQNEEAKYIVKNSELIKIYEDAMDKLEARLLANGAEGWGDVVNEPFTDEMMEFVPILSEGEKNWCVQEWFSNLSARMVAVESELHENDGKEYIDYNTYSYSEWQDISKTKAGVTTPAELFTRIDSLNTRIARAENEVSIQRDDSIWDDVSWKYRGEDEDVERKVWQCRDLFRLEDTYKEYVNAYQERVLNDYKLGLGNLYEERSDVRSALVAADHDSRACGKGRIAGVNLVVDSNGNIIDVRQGRGCTASNDETHCILEKFRQLHLPGYSELGINAIQIHYSFEQTEEDKAAMKDNICVDRLLSDHSDFIGEARLLDKVESIFDKKAQNYMSREDVRKAVGVLDEKFVQCGNVCRGAIGMAVTSDGHLLPLGEYDHDVVDGSTYACMMEAMRQTVLPSIGDDEVLKLKYDYVPAKEAEQCKTKREAAIAAREAEYEAKVEKSYEQIKVRLEELKKVKNNEGTLGKIGDIDKMISSLQLMVDLQDEVKKCGRHVNAGATCTVLPDGKISVDKIHAKIDDSFASARFDEACFRKAIESYVMPNFKGEKSIERLGFMF